MSKGEKQRIFFSRPADRSLEAYKFWIRSVTAQLGGMDDMTDAEWEAGWREFWRPSAAGPAGTTSEGATPDSSARSSRGPK